MVRMTDKSKAFLKEYIPDALNKEEVKSVLRLLYDLIVEKGFAPPHYDEYNDFGREAQKVYDDIYLSAQEE